MSEKRNVRRMQRTKNLTNGSMALNVRSSALPKKRYVPKRQPETAKKPKLQKQRYANMEMAPSIDFWGFAGFMIVAALLVIISVGYIRVYNEVKQTEIETRAINREVNNLKIANDNIENTLYSNIDLEKIRKTAIEKYGMVYPYENQVIAYKSVTIGYVRQCGDLKGNETPSLIERILRVVNAK